MVDFLFNYGDLVFSGAVCVIGLGLLAFYPSSLEG